MKALRCRFRIWVDSDLSVIYSKPPESVNLYH